MSPFSVSTGVSSAVTFSCVTSLPIIPELRHVRVHVQQISVSTVNAVYPSLTGVQSSRNIEGEIKPKARKLK